MFGVRTGRRKVIQHEGDSREMVNIASVESFTAEQIREIRLKAGMSRITFASYLGVSVKAVEAWEAGRNHPEGPACRLLTLTRDHPRFAYIYGIIVK